MWLAWILNGCTLPTSPDAPVAIAPRDDRQGTVRLGEGSASDLSAVKSTLSTSTDPWVQCYESRLEAQPELSGQLDLTWTIAADGQVVSPLVASSTLHDEDLDRCVLRRLERLRFPSRTRGEARWTVHFEPGRAAVVPPARPVPVSGDVRPPTPAVEARIKRSGRQIQYCFQRRRVHVPGLHGDLTYRWTIDARGAATKIRLLSDTMNDPDVASCVRGRIHRMKFPAEEAGRFEKTFSFAP